MWDMRMTRVSVGQSWNAHGSSGSEAPPGLDPPASAEGIAVEGSRAWPGIAAVAVGDDGDGAADEAMMLTIAQIVIMIGWEMPLLIVRCCVVVAAGCFVLHSMIVVPPTLPDPLSSLR